MPPYHRSPFKAVDFLDFSGARAAGYFWIFAHAPPNKNLVDGRVLGRGWWIRKAGFLYTPKPGGRGWWISKRGFLYTPMPGCQKGCFSRRGLEQPTNICRLAPRFGGYQNPRVTPMQDNGGRDPARHPSSIRRRILFNDFAAALVYVLTPRFFGGTLRHLYDCACSKVLGRIWASLAPLLWLHGSHTDFLLSCAIAWAPRFLYGLPYIF